MLSIWTRFAAINTLDTAIYLLTCSAFRNHSSSCSAWHAQWRMHWKSEEVIISFREDFFLVNNTYFRLFKNVSDIALLWLLIVLRFCFEQWIRIENGISYYYNKLKRYFIEKVPSSFKLPSHLGFVLIHEEDNDTDRLVLLVSKCAMLGICHVTLYRMRLWNSTERYKLIYQVKKKLNYCTKSEWLLQDSMGKFTLYNENGQRFCCSILDIRSGRFSIVQALKEYSHKQACCEEVTFDERQFVETFLDGQHCLEDVEYLLFFGGVVTVAGFPPLSLRWTEFGALPPLKDVQERHLLESLHSFALKEQRFGK